MGTWSTGSNDVGLIQSTKAPPVNAERMVSLRGRLWGRFSPLEGYLAHMKLPPPLAPQYAHSIVCDHGDAGALVTGALVHTDTVEIYGGGGFLWASHPCNGVSYERGTPAMVPKPLRPRGRCSPLQRFLAHNKHPTPLGPP